MTIPARILPRAQEDFRCIFAHIEERSPDGAERWKQSFTSAVERLKENPAQFGLAPENELADLELRQMLFKTPRGHTYRAVFAEIEGETLVLRIRGTGQPDLKRDEMPLG